MFNSEGRWTEILTDDAIAPNDLVALGSRGDSGWAPHPIKDAIMDMTLYTSIAPARNLTLTNEVVIDGSATFEMKYL